MDERDTQVRMTLGDGMTVPFERAAPVRPFPVYKVQRNFPGFYYAATMDAHVPFESWLERDTAIALDFHYDVVSIAAQPFWLSWSGTGRARSHAPDFFARTLEGTGVVIDCRPTDRNLASRPHAALRRDDAGLGGDRVSRLLCVGDRVLFDDIEHQVVALAGTQVRLVAADGTPSVVLLSHLVGSLGFMFLSGEPAPAANALAGQLLDDVAPELAARAREWERHVVEVETGLPPEAAPGARPRPEYDPQARTVRERDAAKAAELTAAGVATSATTVKRMRMRYRAEGLRGLVDGRGRKRSTPLGRSDARVVQAVREALDGETSRSTGTVDRLRRRVEAILAERHGAGEVALPSRATFYRLVNKLSAGKHTFGAAATRRSAATGRTDRSPRAGRPGRAGRCRSTRPRWTCKRCSTTVTPAASS
ncbi:TnsA-like heteromeric transposase endonuclease subunit [Amycolatopsis coloradensis]|uniref:TnsA-like heteromeric transposase endonuclease subunit n=1 Tax=Amycolatopsis coloradensis TaxID=76021 RepID=UPI0013011928|nr:TnsA-like heteromeric transposase endonuclease subunit [Amycolatopsis coloradensis]